MGHAASVRRWLGGWGVLALLLAGTPAWAQVDGAFALLKPELRETLPIIHAGEAHALGMTGSGVVVAVVDIFDPNPKDPCGSAHGVWIEGLIAGVAPGARVVRFGVRTVPAPNSGGCFVMDSGDINRALQRILDEHDRSGIRVVNLSWGGGQYARPCGGQRSTTTRLIQDLVRAGLTVVAAAGNEGLNGALIWPACLPEVISVGASFDHDGATPERTAQCAQMPVVDEITCYSNTADFLDVLAPGSRASVSGGPSGLGTSASTAFVSGVVALLDQANAALTPEAVRQALRQTGKPVRDPRNHLTFPRVDALAALQAVRPALRANAHPLRKGDVNLDGELTQQDALTLLSALGQRLQLSERQTEAADVAAPCDGTPTFTDYHYLKRMLQEGVQTACAEPDAPLGAGASGTVASPHPRGTSFQLNGAEALQLTVFDLSGNPIYTSARALGDRLDWAWVSDGGWRAPNGVYLYVVRAWSRGALTVRTGKLVVLR